MIHQSTVHTFRVTSFRCHEAIVIAQMEQKQIFYWGEMKTGDNITVTQCPRRVVELTHPRNLFGQAMYPGTWGITYTGTMFGD